MGSFGIETLPNRHERITGVKQKPGGAMTCSRVAYLAVSLCLSSVVMAQPGPQATNRFSTTHEPAPGISTLVESFYNAGPLGGEIITYHFCNNSGKPIIFWWEDVGMGSTGAGGWSPGCGQAERMALAVKSARPAVNYFAYGEKREASAFLADNPPSEKLDERIWEHVTSKFDAKVYVEPQRIDIRARVEVDFSFAKGETTLNVRWHEGIYAVAIGGLLDDPVVLDQLATRIRTDAALKNTRIRETKELPTQLALPGVVPLDRLQIADRRFLFVGSELFSRTGGGELSIKYKPRRAPRTIDSEPLIFYDEKQQIVFIIHYSVPR